VNRASYRDAIQHTNVLTVLAEHDPHVAGTPPLGLDLPSSDIDVLCFAPDLDRFTTTLWAAFGSYPNFRIWQWSGADRPVVASFEAQDWCFEIFGQAKPVIEQMAWRHFAVERRLIALGGQRLATTVMALRREGLKTEPAFAAALRLQGDPYETLSKMSDLDDDALSHLIAQACN
jgi:hypothetical protein